MGVARKHKAPRALPSAFLEDSRSLDSISRQNHMRTGLALLVGAASALSMQPPMAAVRPLLSTRRAATVRCGFEVEDMEKKALDELGVMNWPNLEKRTADFSKSAAGDELLMLYVKDGSATLTEGDETATASAGQIVMVSSGEVRWSGLGEGVTLLSVVTALEPDGEVIDDGLDDEVASKTRLPPQPPPTLLEAHPRSSVAIARLIYCILQANALKANIAKSLTGSTRGLSSSGVADEDVSPVEYAGLLAAGLLAGGLLSFGLKTFQTPDGL